jgi:hypothetical protein
MAPDDVPGLINDIELHSTARQATIMRRSS